MKARKRKAIFYHRFNGGVMGQCAFDLVGGNPLTGVCRLWGEPEGIDEAEWVLWGRYISEVLRTEPNILAKIMIATELSGEER